ncbi:MAG: histone deacetylase [Kiritimatiellae bacterium]|nr:histone deacetylase [Kiritimatiellia bacterium]MDW8457530.1 histone deacetylase [Verrucomicrobiota bacterium]
MVSRYLHTGLVADPICKLHDTGLGHPECPSRYDAAFRALCAKGLIDHLEKIPCREALDRELELCHTPEYIDLVAQETASGATTLSTGDVEICPRSLEVCRYVVGGILNAVDAVCARKVKNAFCLVRPPGHHASADRGMGFCLFNNAALAARHAQVEHDIERVAIIDWDVHHGNGTQDIFYADDTVLYFSVHQWPLYPGTGARHERGAGRGMGTTLNIPLPAGSGREEIFRAFEEELGPALDRFRPDLIILSAGFDSRVDDPLGSFTLTDDDFADLTDWVLRRADDYADGRLLSILEGGYNLSGLASAVVAHVGQLIEG